MADRAYAYEADSDWVHGGGILAGRHEICVFGLWLLFDPIPLCIRYWLGLFCSLRSLYRTLGAGFSELRWFYGGWLEIMGDHDVSLGFVVFPDVTAVRGHISPNVLS